MKHPIFLLIMLSIYVGAIGQQKDSLIRLRHGLLGLRFYQHDQKMNLSKISYVMTSNQEAYKIIKTAKTNQTVAIVLGVTGGALVDLGLVEMTTLFVDPHYAFWAVGGILTITSAILSIRSRNQAEKAVEVYNEGIKKTGYKPALRFGFHGTGISLAVNF